MDIELYVSVSEPTVLQKTIISVTTIQGQLRNDSNVSNPDILIAGDLIQSDVLNANYAKISAFGGRYYFIRELKSIRQNLWLLSLKCDVLMSFANAIKASQAIVEETATIGAGGNVYLNNNAFVSQVKTKTDIIPFDTGFEDNPQFILITAGGFAT